MVVRSVVYAGISPEQLQRMHRMYRSRSEAARALGVSADTVRKTAKRHGIEEPSAWRAKPVS